ncbi:hypothetical protein quinque_001832 [Culex quinquefasciatus]
MASPRRILLLVAAVLIQAHRTDQALPLVINTWAFTNATLRAHQWLVVGEAGPIDALVEGCSVCEREQCDGTVGYGGSPDENGETTLDAMIMDGSTMNIGAVAAMRDVKHAAAVARHVLENTKHTLLVGDRATEFAVQMGFKRESLETERSKEMWEQWKNNHCNVVAGTSTNGARNKIPGRVGDSPIPGSGAYADSTVGAAAATGDGDIMMRFMPSLLAVEGLRRGLSPVQAGETALARIAVHYPKFVGGIVVASSDGQYGAACHGMDEFPYSVAEGRKETEVVVKKVKCRTKRR